MRVHVRFILNSRYSVLSTQTTIAMVKPNSSNDQTSGMLNEMLILFSVYIVIVFPIGHVYMIFNKNVINSYSNITRVFDSECFRVTIAEK